MFTRTRLIGVVMIAAMFAGGIANAQSMKIGVVNFARLVSESPHATSATAALQEEFAPRQRQVVALQNELKERQEQIQRDLEVMGPEERRNAERDLRQGERDLARSQQEFQEDFNLRRNEALGKLQRQLLTEVQTYSAAQGFDLVVGEGVVYASSAIDITEQVLAGLKESFAKSNGTAP